MLLHEINMDPDIIDVLAKINNPAPESLIIQLTDSQTSQAAREQLLNYKNPEYKGMDMLKWMIEAAALAKDSFDQAGIPDEIYIQTMKAFSRFARECRDGYGDYIFDRDHWCWRHCCLLIFRTGSLEYELCPNEREIHIHIPSDADLGLEACSVSKKEFRQIILSRFPEYMSAPYKTESWLLAPALQKLLKPDSKILQFQNCFDIDQVFEDDMEYRKWIFGRKEKISPSPDTELPETTSLQKSAKAWLLSGRKIGAARGTLKSFGDMQ